MRNVPTTQKETATKEQVERISYAKVWGETRQEKSKYLEDLHTEYHEQVGYKYGLERGIPYEELSEEEKRGRKHKDKRTLEAERQTKLAIAEAEKQKAEIEAETAVILNQKDEAQKELKSAQWNVLWLEPEFVDAAKKLKARKHREELEAREIAERKENILNIFIKQGHEAQREFATQKGRYKMTDTEAFRIYYGILAVAVRDKLTIAGSASAKSAAHRFLDCCSWTGVTEYQHNLHCHWTEQFAEKAGFPDNAVENFIAFVDEMSCSAENYVSLMGSNGCADPLGLQGRFACKELINWDGTKKRGLAAPEKKKDKGMSR